MISFREPFSTFPANWVSTESVRMSTLSHGMVFRTWYSAPSMSKLRKSTVGLPRANKRLKSGRHCISTTSPTPLAPSASIPAWVSSEEPPRENLIISGRCFVDRQVLTVQADLFLETNFSYRDGRGSTSKPDQSCCFSKCQLADVASPPSAAPASMKKPPFFFSKK